MKNLILTNDTSFKDAIAVLDENGNGFLSIVDSDDHLIGILTDGDVRRAILNDISDINDIINKTPTTVPAGTTRAQMVSMLKDMHRRHMPVIDDEGRLLEVVSLDEVEFNHKPNTVVIMAGGLGSRLGELTKETPKPMLHVGDKPMLVHIIESFNDYGFTDIIISVNFKAEKIKSYFGDGSKFGVKIKYIEEKERLGTAGALSLLDEKPELPFFLINGDVLTAVNYEKLLEYHNKNSADATMCIRGYDHEVPYGVISTDDQNNILELQEKPINTYYVNSGVYVLSPEVLDYIPQNKYYDMPSLFKELVDNHKVAKTYHLTDYWIDVGNPVDYETANNKLSK